MGLVAVNLMLSTVPAPASQTTKHRFPIQAQSGHHAPPYLWWDPPHCRERDPEPSAQSQHQQSLDQVGPRPDE